MGLGDDMMFLGEAEHLHKETGKQIVPVYHNGWSPFFKNVEFLTRNKTSESVTLNARDTTQHSDYHVDYYVAGKESTLLGTRQVFRPYSPKPFRLRFSEKELDKIDKILLKYNINDEFVIINPDYKSSFFGKNKNWGFKKYQQLTDMLNKDIQVVRILPGGEYNEPPLKNATNIVCEGLRLSAGIYSKAKFGISYDGLLQHILAGFEVPCVVLQGGLISKVNMNYQKHIMIGYDHAQTPCGSMYDCPHCADANKNMTVEMVYKECEKLL